MPRPVVAIVGRPNVGKSTLFNRIIGERQAIVEDEPGTTRDRNYGQAEWNGIAFTLIDTGGIDTGADETGDPDIILSHIREQAAVAVAEADAIVFVVDARDGLTAADEIIGTELRRASKSVLLAANKAESEERRYSSAEFYALGLGEPMPISAYHGSGTGDLLDCLVALLPPGLAEDEDDTSIKIAIAGRPNVGKSSLLNTLLGEQRSIVSEIPGTTRDAVDTRITWGEQVVTLIDTAGIRRRGRIEQGVEKYSVIRALRAVGRADVVLLVVDSAEGLTAQDAHVAGYVQDEYKGMVVVMNKWDLVTKDSDTMREYTEHVQQVLNWTAHVPIVFISALTGQRVEQAMEAALAVAAERDKRVSTGALNRVLRTAFEQHPPPARPGSRLKFFYATQPTTKPPTFILYVNDAELIHFSYRRYLENVIRREYGFDGVPLRLSFRQRGGPD